MLTNTGLSPSFPLDPEQISWKEWGALGFNKLSRQILRVVQCGFAWHRYHRDQRILKDLDARTLEDIGLTRTSASRQNRGDPRFF